ncbi:quinon protein alcohol dehydrogenase-like superfamily [Jimgerdemannia flammicorona]|uniref:Quinon protein alcohol dehydrogenase-like superfamily n=1 Tax=Jimgerdemannia flammicorona TaxID=994334 RepID=A0A433QS17_9FUNG|nr:quinon protein alcohol dehydrogenase-like superfamily [Jimgerdemannia flammicorona]
MGKPHHFLVNVDLPVFCLAFTPDNKLVVGGGGGPGRSGVNNKLVLYNIDAPKETAAEYASRLLSNEEDAPMCLSVHPEELIFACGINSQEKAIQAGDNKNLRMFKYGDNLIEPVKSVQTIESRQPIDYQKVARFSRDGKYLVTGTTDGRLTVLRYPSFKAAFPPINLDKKEVLDADVDAASDRIVAVTAKILRLMAVKDGRVLQTIDNPTLNKKTTCEFRACRWVDSGAGGQRDGFAAYGRDYYYHRIFEDMDAMPITTSFFPLLPSTPITPPQLRRRQNLRLPLHRRQSDVANAWVYLQVACRHVAESQERGREQEADHGVHDQGHLLAYASSDLVIGIADADNLRPLFQIKNAHGFSITCLAFNRDDRILVSGSVDSRCRVVDLPAKLEKESFSPFLAVFIALIIAVIGYLLSSGFYDFPSHG